MRVIGGEFRSRQLVTPRGVATRPTTDRLRETLFNVLSPRLPGSRVLDLYAGSGAVGIEALSRGAAFAALVERAPAAVSAIRANLAALKITAGYRVEARAVARTLEELARAGERFGLVFLDPPYEAAAEYAATLGALGGSAVGVLGEEAWVIAEHARRTALAESYGRLRRFRVLEQGDAALSFYAGE
jgi:16S rRNA (guanine966-N2)-methyltransferase